MLLFLCEFEVLVALDAARADLDATASRSLRKCDPLEVGVLARVTRRIELGRADAIRIAACHATSLCTSDTYV